MQSIGGTPPWMPLEVYDDGRQTFIRFKELLDFTAAPAVFARHPDGRLVKELKRVFLL